MANFDQIAEKAEVSLSPSEWEPVDQRLTARFEDFLKGAEKRDDVGRIARIKTALTWFFSKPAIAYVFVLALLYPAYLGIFQKPRIVKEVVKEKEVVQVAGPVLDIETPPSFELELVRGPVEGKGEETEIKLSSQEKFFILSFFLPLRPNLRYDAEIVDSHRNRIVEKKDIKSYDGKGNFTLVCGRQLFSSGSYELKVKSVDRQTNRVDKQFPPFGFKM